METATPKPPKKRCIVYVDGFNLYFGVLEDHPEWRWLNLQTFCESLRPDEDVVAIKYCTAKIDPKKAKSDRRDRQELYLRALETLPKVKQILGRYQMRRVTCRAPACSLSAQYDSPEEKKTDVNLAVQMISDAIDGAAETIVLISGDSDLEPAVEMVKRRFGHIRIIVYIPVLPNPKNPRSNFFYRGIQVPCGEMPIKGIPENQFPAVIQTANGGKIIRPAEWI